MALHKTEEELKKLALELTRTAASQLKQNLHEEQLRHAQRFIFENLKQQPEMTAQQIAITSYMGVLSTNTPNIHQQPILQINWGNQLLIPLLNPKPSPMQSRIEKSQHLQQGFATSSDQTSTEVKTLISMGIPTLKMQNNMKQYLEEENERYKHLPRLKPQGFI